MKLAQQKPETQYQVIALFYDKFIQETDSKTKYTLYQCIKYALNNNIDEFMLDSAPKDFVEKVIYHIGWSDCDDQKDFLTIEFLAKSTGLKKYRDMYIASELFSDHTWVNEFFESTVFKECFCTWMSYKNNFVYAKNITDLQVLQLDNNTQDTSIFNESDLINIVAQASQQLSLFSCQFRVMQLVGDLQKQSMITVVNIKELVVLSLKYYRCIDITESLQLQQLILEDVEGLQVQYLVNKQYLQKLFLDNVQMANAHSEQLLDNQQSLENILTDLCMQNSQLFYLNVSRCILPPELTLNININLQILILFMNKNLKQVFINSSSQNQHKLELIDVYNYENNRFGYNVIRLNIQNDIAMPNLSFINCANIDSVQERFGLLNSVTHYCS